MSDRQLFHIIYIPGLGDGYDFVRAIGLRLWRRRGVRVTLVPMRWSNPAETLDQKLARISDAVEQGGRASPVFVGESAGGPVAMACIKRYADHKPHAVTVCGMNQGSQNVSPMLYRKNPAFRTAMELADRLVPTLTDTEKKRMLTLYSSLDMSVRPRDTLLDGVDAYDLRSPGHQLAILLVLFWRYRLILRKFR